MNEKIFSKFDESELLTLKFSTNDFTSKLIWHDENEFELNGKMYDVVKIEECSDEFTVYCYNDEKEELLISNFKKLNDVKSEGKNLLTTRLNIFVLYAVQFDYQSIKRYFNTQLQQHPTTNNYLSVSIDTITPPPKISL